jgi:acylglycerol lipase
MMLISAQVRERQQWLEGDDGRIFVRRWEAVGRPTASLVICHGFNAHSDHYARAAEVFAQRGFEVTALDLRGRSRSDGERFHVETFEDYISDLSKAIDLARATNPGLPVHLLGHSAGGIIALAYALEHQDRISGLICESIALRLPSPAIAVTLLRGVSHLAPHAHVVRLRNADFSRDPAWVAQLDADPLIRDEVQTVQAIAALARAASKAAAQFDRIVLPVFMMHGTSDRAALQAGTQQLFDTVESQDKTLRLYDGFYHDLLNDLGRDRVTNDIGNWIEQRAT